MSNRESDGVESVESAPHSGDLHEEYEPDAPIHKAVNITYRLLKDRIEPVEHEEYDLWKARDDKTGRESDSWWRDPDEAVDLLARSIDNELCYVNECTNHLGKDSERLYCDGHTESEYIECAVEDCDYPRNHPDTDHCSGHTWRLGRDGSTEGSA